MPSMTEDLDLEEEDAEPEVNEELEEDSEPEVIEELEEEPMMIEDLDLEEEEETPSLLGFVELYQTAKEQTEIYDLLLDNFAQVDPKAFASKVLKLVDSSGDSNISKSEFKTFVRKAIRPKFKKYEDQVVSQFMQLFK